MKLDSYSRICDFVIYYLYVCCLLRRQKTAVDQENEVSRLDFIAWLSICRLGSNYWCHVHCYPLFSAILILINDHVKYFLTVHDMVIPW